VIQSWRGRESLFEAARGGYSGILSNGYYIDLIQPTDFHYLNDPLPADAGLSSEEAGRILGGEATMWSEFVSPETVDSRIWPRTAAIAERLWSPREVRDVADMYRRLDPVSRQLEQLGLQHERNRPVMLRRLCQCRDLGPLEVLLGAIEPVKVYNRGRLRPHTQFSPLTRTVDAAWPDAGPAREFRWTVDRLLDIGSGGGGDLVAARTALAVWRDNRDVLEPILKAAPALHEMAPMSEALHEVAALGLEALELLGADTEAGPGWLQPRLERLQAARTTHGQTELMIVDPVARLVCAAAGPAGLTDPGCLPADEATPEAEH
jgi:hexosaminidase